MFTLNDKPIIECQSFSQPTATDFKTPSFKNRQYKNVINAVNPYCRQVLESMMALSKHANRKYNYVFIRTYDLEKNKAPSLPIWHLDSSLNPTDDYENFIFVTGFSSLTEFMTNKVILPKQETPNEFDESIETLMKETINIESATIYAYSGSNVHRGTKALSTEKRLLIRLQNTNKRLPTFNY